MLKSILKIFLSLTLLKLVDNNESCPNWSEWKKFKDYYKITLDPTVLTELEAYIYKHKNSKSLGKIKIIF